MSRSVLILDDEQGRHDVFDVWLEEHAVKHAYSVQSAVAFMFNTKFDVVFLDHDLGEGRPTGYEIAKWMATEMSKTKWPGLVVIHSLNPFGAERMHSTLREAGFNVQKVPFGSRIVKLT